MFNKLLNLFKKKKENNTSNKTLINSSIEAIDIEIEKHKKNITNKKNLEDKYFIYKQIVKLLLKKRFLLSDNGYIKNAYALLGDFFEDDLYSALIYLNNINTDKLSKEYIYEIYTFKALILELLEDFTEATNCYKNLILLTNSEKAIQDFKDYAKRQKELLSWQKEYKEKIILDDLYTLHNNTPIEELPKSVKSLENIALYYVKSPKSRQVAKRYFKEVLKIYKKLYEYNPKEFSCDYIKALIDAVELFMLSTLFLKEAQKLLEKDNLCIKNRVYLIERLKNLKNKDFVKRSKAYKTF